MRCKSSQCDQYFTKWVKFTHSSTHNFLKTSIFISLLGKNLFTSCFQESITNYFELVGNLQIWRMNWKLGAVFGDRG